MKDMNNWIKKVSASLLVLALAFSLHAEAQTPPAPPIVTPTPATPTALVPPLPPKLPAPFPFVLPWDDAAPSAINLSSWLDTLAGAHQFITAKDGHLFLRNKRIRLFGVNLSLGANFPSHEEADKIAGRLAKFGIGCVRLHRLDAKPSPLGLLGADNATLDPSQLEKLDYFVSALKEHGLHVDLVLHDGRVYPNFPTWDNMPDCYQGVDNFYPPMIEAQRKYAADLLHHVNSYTKTSYANEPAVAFIEINNESSLLHAWWNYQLDDMPAVYAKELQDQWNKWLTAKYGTDDKLRAQWNAHEAPAGPELLGGNGYSTWTAEGKYPASVKSQPATTEPFPATWIHVGKPGIDAGQGIYVRYHQAIDTTKNYNFTFQAKSDRPRVITIAINQVNGFYGVAVNLPVAITAEWKKYSVTFVPTMSIGEAEFGFHGLAGEVSDWCFADLSLKTSAAQGLPEAEKLGAVATLNKRDFYGRTAEAQNDWIAFLVDTEKKYWTGMDKYLKETLKTQSLVMGTQTDASPSLIQSELDAVNAHGSWQPPRFPNPANPDEWISKSLSMVTDPKGGAISRLAAMRVAGKPFICTEYDEPAPNTFSSESFLLLGAYAALQDWDAVFVSSYSSDLGTMKSRMIGDFYDIAQNPAKMATLPASVALFVRGDVQTAAPHIVSLQSGPYLDQLQKTGPATDLTNFGVYADEALRHPLQLASDGASSPGNPPVRSVFPGITSDTMDLRWNSTPDQSCVTIDTAKSAGIIGFGRDISFPLSRVTITPHATLQGWSTINATVLEGDNFQTARRILITATGSSANTGMKWKSGEEASLSKGWGNAPSLVEGVSATLTLPASGDAKAWALDETGRRKTEIPIKIDHDRITIEIGPESKTLWYEIEVTPSGAAVPH
jgi:hypothetical protein